MGYLARAVVQALAAHAIVSSGVALVVAMTWARLATPQGLSASRAATRLFLLRLAPSAAGLTAAVLVLAGYGLWEGRGGGEVVGPLALACAAAGGLLFATGALRLAGALRMTRRITRELERSAQALLPAWTLPSFVVDAPFPVVALVGIVRTRLFVARRVLDACTREEMAAVVAHEHGHARQRDNLRRLVMTAAPDALSTCAAGGRLETAWSRAAELAADEWASTRTSNGIPLASALIKVARMAVASVDPLPASALFRGDPIAERVDRLLDPPAVSTAAPWPAWKRAAALTLAIVSALAAVPIVYDAAEQLFRLGL
jgi:Zn-dependent protease with chaperone function